MLSFTTKEAGSVLVIAFEATDDHATDWQSTQRDWLYKLIESHPDPRFVIDLSDVNYLARSSSGCVFESCSRHSVRAERSQR